MDYEIYHNDDYAEVITHGDGAADGFRDLLKELCGHPRWKPGFPLLINHADLNAGTLTIPGMEVLADIVHTQKEALGMSRMAILVPGDLEYGMGRMWQVFVDNKWKGVSEVFRERGDALDWLLQK